MRLFIAEKPSLGRAIADVLPKPHSKGDGYISAANGDTVSWCIGHLLEQVEPDAYNPAFKKWSHDHLPIIPVEWKLSAKKNTAKQLAVLRRLIKQADQLVHAGDPDREGQLLVDEVINFVGVKGAKKNSIQRCLISDLNPAAVRTAINALRDNREFIPLSTSALARSRADWLYGMNLTRAYTLQGKQAGYNGVLSVGRVQTPVLGLVVRRDQAIENFVSKPFYEVWANLETDKGEKFKAKWKPSEQCAQFLDEQGRNLSKPLAENIVGRISHQPAEVSNLKRQLKKLPPPLPYNLSALQIDASKAFGLSAKQVLDTCQALYEKHKLITYPRSDCRHLPKAHFEQRQSVITAIQTNAPTLNDANPSLGKVIDDINNCSAFDSKRRSKAWNDSKVGAHHAIIPTQKKLSQSKSLSSIEAKIYSLVCRNYLAQFFSLHEFYSVNVEVKIGTGIFIANAKEITEEGWRCLFPSSAKNKSNNTSAGKEHDREDTQQLLPPLKIGQALKSLQGEVLEKFTTPPKAFTDATLLAAMTGISAHVSDVELKKVLRETDGLGTEATRAGIIELLFTRGFLSRSGKTINSTETGRALIEALPPVATLPDMTAQWEAQLLAISEGRSSYQQLMTPLEARLDQLVKDSRTVIPIGLKGLGKKPTWNRGKRKVSSNKSLTKKTGTKKKARPKASAK